MEDKMPLLPSISDELAAHHLYHGLLVDDHLLRAQALLETILKGNIEMQTTFSRQAECENRNILWQ